MKRLMLGTSALFALGLAAGTAAAEETPGKISLGLGGFYRGVVTVSAQSDVDTFGDVDGDGEPIGDGEEDTFYPVAFRQDSEIHFKGQTALDNGITVGFRTELEAVSRGAGQIDEAFLFFQGSFGRMVMGIDDDAAATMQYAEPSATGGVTAANSPLFFPFERANAAPTGTYLGVVTLDAPKIIYFTPRFGGFQLGVSYTPSVDNVGGAEQFGGLFRDEDGGFGNAVSAGVNYEADLGGLNIALSAGADTAAAEDDGADDALQFAVGGTVGFNGFSVGGSVKIDDPGESIAFSAGLMYEVGAWAASVGFFHSEIDNDAEEALTVADISFNYALSPSVNIIASGQFMTEDSVAEDNPNGFGVILGSAITF